MKLAELFETFDKPYPLNWSEPDDEVTASMPWLGGDKRAFAKLPDGTPLLIMFNHEGNEEYQVEFHRSNSQDVTGEGDAYKIFATVLYAIQKFIKERSPEMIFFSGMKGNTGKNPSRTKLYTRMVQKFARQLGYNAYVEDQGDMVQYELNKINNESVNEDVKQADLDAIEKYADKIFSKIGIDIEFTRHFIDRVNDERNQKPITTAELTRLFKQEYKKWGKPIARLGPDAQGVMKDMATDVNVPFVLLWDRENEELDLVAKTVMRKRDFKTSNPEFPVENLSLVGSYKRKKERELNLQPGDEDWFKLWFGRPHLTGPVKLKKNKK